jgi:hypothetical protein
MGIGIRAALNARFVAKNRRAAPRHRYNGNDAWIRVGGSLTRRCQVLDLSQTGVRLAVTSPHSLPDTFTLIFSKNSSGCRLARVKWWRGTEVGAEFFAVDSCSVSHLSADPPRANPSLASRLALDAPRINSSQASGLTAVAPRAGTSREGKGQKSGNLISTLSFRTPAAQQDIPKPKALGPGNGDKAKFEAHCQTPDISGQVDRADREQSSKNRMDLSRLQKKLGPKHVALIHALKDVDPESPHGRELASIIEGLDANSDSQRAI